MRLAHSAFSFDTIFVGGGTPSLLTQAQLGQIFDSLHKHSLITNGAEISIESNPGSLTAELLKFYRELGINRLSIGVQSFNDEDLRFLGRVHSSAGAERAICEAQDAGFQNLNIDLIFEIPGQTTNTWRKNLDMVNKLSVPHVSAYSLIYEENTPIFDSLQRGEIEQFPEDDTADLYLLTDKILDASGFTHYEISNFARAGLECRHNLNYWNRGEYIGLGPSAHGFTGAIRYWNKRNLDEYLAAILAGKLPTEGEELIGRVEAIEEYVYLGLRAGGISLEELRNKYSVELSDAVLKMFDQWVSNQIAVLSGNILRLTSAGYLLADRLSLDLMNNID